ncbi:MAG: hypothetical protein J7604_12515 [Sporocytophaga sp.]|uniref:hypothetical protein n=1 Tax=Sporocytophaga sp. TaxID=2231183 RepID=UPI001B115051|nr:hypothetical protein [Sporocytophaga sp.]MBO9701028.1 hypothetical protein [Sporocytophaga sp.]
MKYFAALLLLFHYTFVQGQEFQYPLVKKEGKKVIDFIPKGWNLVDTVEGDLNKDSYKDIAFVIEHRDDRKINTESFQHFILIIAFYNPESSNFRFIEQCNNLISYHQLEPGPWYEGMEIVKGVLNISFLQGGSTDIMMNYKFRYQDNDFYMIGADRSQYNPSSQDYKNYSFNFLAKKWSISKGNDESPEKSTVEWRKLEIEQLMKLKDYEGPFTWEVAKGMFL